MKKVIFALALVLLFATCKKEIPQKQLTVNVTPDVGGSVTPSSGTYAMGSTVKVLATPSAEYVFKEWTGGFSGSTNPGNVIMDVDKTVTAVFEKREYPLSLTIVGSGTVKEEIIKIAGASTNYKSGTTVRLTPQPSEGYQFKGWSGDDTTSRSTLDLIVSKAINLTCTFEKEEAIKFSTNLDTGNYNLVDTLPLVITVNSKLPKAGILYSVLVNWTDSSKQIFKLDTSLNVSSLSLKIPGLKKVGAYSLSVTVTSKSSSTNTLNKSFNFLNSPIVPAINTDLFPDLNWNDHSQSKNSPYDFNNDGIPDILTYRRISNTSVLPPIFEIKDYTGKSIFTFNIKDINPKVRDSLNNLIYDYRDINGDGYLDLALTYMGEWWFGQPGAEGSVAKYYGANTYLLISKGNLQYDVTEIINNLDNQAQFNVNLFDWDFDGKVDVLPNSMSEGTYFKNMGDNKFEKRVLTPLFSQMIGNKLDYDKDGKLDFVNLFVRQKDEFGNYNTTNTAQTLTVVTAKEALNFPVIGKVIDKSIFMSANVRSSERITMIDGDGDGDMDLVVGSVLMENNVWSYFQDYFENTGSKFEYRDNYIEIDKSLIGEFQSWTYDIDNDGDMDLFYPTYSKSKLGTPKWSYFWWENTKKGFKINKKFRLKY
jgi:uncharacterized repeat protein (TIGR02543 family)